MKLILTEKPDAARKIAAVVGAKSKKEGYLEGNGYCVSWAIGHLIETLEPEGQDANWKDWRLETLPLMPDELKTQVIPQKAKQFKIIKELVKQAEVIINAGDCGQEGEAIQRLILEHCQFKKSHKRLWYSSFVEKEIQRAFQDLRESSAYDALYACAKLRAYADWTFGMSLTRAMSLKAGQTLHIGRVSTPTLNAIVKRCREHETFVPREFQVLTASFGEVKLSSDELKPEQMEQLKLPVEQELVLSIEKEVKEIAPLQFFSLETLQQEANRVFSFTADETLKIAQSLYESQLITYPRTDSKHLPSDFDKMSIKSIFIIHQKLFVDYTESKRFFDSSKVEDHHAIIPTEQVASLEDEKTRELYELICARFFQAFQPPAQVETLKISSCFDGIELKGSLGRDVILGWKAHYPYVSVNSDEWLEFQDGQSVQACLDLERRTTKPPALFNDASILGFMKNPKSESDEKTSNGIGTPATRAGILKELQNRGYTLHKGKSIVATDKAYTLIDATPVATLKNPDITIALEKLFDSLKKGTISYEQAKCQMQETLQVLIQDVLKLPTQINKDSKSYGLCPVCAEPVLYGKYGLYCKNKDFSLPISFCGKKIQSHWKTLMKGQQTPLIKGFQSKAGKAFDAFLVLNDNKIQCLFNN